MLYIICVVFVMQNFVCSTCNTLLVGICTLKLYINRPDLFICGNTHAMKWDECISHLIKHMHLTPTHIFPHIISKPSLYYFFPIPSWFQ